MPDDALAAAVQREKAILTETIGSVLWFVMDGMWMLNQARAAKLLIAPVLLVNFLVFRYIRTSFSQIAVVAAMNSWLVMNIFWMVGDLDKQPRQLLYARVFFGLGVVLLIAAVIRDAFHPERLKTVLSHFRRLRT